MHKLLKSLKSLFCGHVDRVSSNSKPNSEQEKTNLRYDPLAIDDGNCHFVQEIDRGPFKCDRWVFDAPVLCDAFLVKSVNLPTHTCGSVGKFLVSCHNAQHDNLNARLMTMINDGAPIFDASLHIIDSLGNTAEEWAFAGCTVSGIDFSTLDYSYNGEFLTYITISYKTLTVK